MKNSLTNNTALFEIKAPQTAVLNGTPFQEGVHTPSSDLSGSINQALVEYSSGPIRGASAMPWTVPISSR